MPNRVGSNEPRIPAPSTNATRNTTAPVAPVAPTTTGPTTWGSGTRPANDSFNTMRANGAAPQVAAAALKPGAKGAAVKEAQNQLIRAGFELPRYYSAVEFHQHPGGVWRDPLAGVAYDFGRRTTLPAHLDPDEIHLPGIFVQRMIHVPEHANIIEFRTTTPR